MGKHPIAIVPVHNLKETDSQTHNLIIEYFELSPFDEEVSSLLAYQSPGRRRAELPSQYVSQIMVVYHCWTLNALLSVHNNPNKSGKSSRSPRIHFRFGMGSANPGLSPLERVA